MVIAGLKEVCPGLECSVRVIETGGDRVSRWSEVRDETGIFVREIEDALFKEEIDMAVHSIKDMPAEQPRGLVLASVLQREDPRDVLISRDGAILHDLPAGAVIGTSSIRRKAQLLRERSDIEVTELRGNIDTRINKLRNGSMAGTVMAAAGLIRIGLKDLITEYLPLEWMPPAPCQGAIGIEVREEDAASRDAALSLNDRASCFCIEAERSFMKHVGAGCRVPVSALATVLSGRLHMGCTLTDVDGRRSVKVYGNAPLDRGDALGEHLAQNLLKSGGRELMAVMSHI
jgi:hydroxymethylbilane synthase